MGFLQYDFPVSRAEAVLNHNINLISLKIENIENYPIIFKRVTETKRLDTNIIQVVLDLLFLLREETML